MAATSEMVSPGAPDHTVVKEQVVTLGDGDNLVAILSRPPPAPAPLKTDAGGEVQRPAVVFLNAGVLHRIGPHRLHVLLARRLAARGFPALRLDLSGIGDSRAVPGSLSFRQSSVLDTRAAMRTLEAMTGRRRFVLFGLCAGADNALATALADPAVTGLVLLDPPTYPTKRALVRKLRARVQTLGLAGAARRALEVTRREVSQGAQAWSQRLLARAGRGGGDAGEATQSGREVPTRAAFGQMLTTLVDRGVAILAVYSGIHAEHYNHEGQLFELYPTLRGRVDVAYFPGANHMFTESAQRARLIERVEAWISARPR